LNPGHYILSRVIWMMEFSNHNNAENKLPLEWGMFAASRF
jgi:hypothetical protein